MKEVHEALVKSLEHKRDAIVNEFKKTTDPLATMFG